MDADAERIRGRRMRYVRFMSHSEFTRYAAGERLTNRTDWRKRAQCTDSIGFCFFDDSIEPEERLAYLTGVVDLDIVAVFERRSAVPMRKSQGRYRDPDRDGTAWPPEMMAVDEYSVKSYNQADMELVKVGVVVDPYFLRKIKWIETQGRNVRSDK